MSIVGSEEDRRDADWRENLEEEGKENELSYLSADSYGATNSTLAAGAVVPSQTDDDRRVNCQLQHGLRLRQTKHVTDDVYSQICGICGVQNGRGAAWHCCYTCRYFVCQYCKMSCVSPKVMLYDLLGKADELVNPTTIPYFGIIPEAQAVNPCIVLRNVGMIPTPIVPIIGNELRRHAKIVNCLNGKSMYEFGLDKVEAFTNLDRWRVEILDKYALDIRKKLGAGENGATLVFEKILYVDDPNVCCAWPRQTNSTASILVFLPVYCHGIKACSLIVTSISSKRITVFDMNLDPPATQYILGFSAQSDFTVEFSSNRPTLAIVYRMASTAISTAVPRNITGASMNEKCVTELLDELLELLNLQRDCQFVCKVLHGKYESIGKGMDVLEGMDRSVVQLLRDAMKNIGFELGLGKVRIRCNSYYDRNTFDRRGPYFMQKPSTLVDVKLLEMIGLTSVLSSLTNAMPAGTRQVFEDEHENEDEDKGENESQLNWTVNRNSLLVSPDRVANALADIKPDDIKVRTSMQSYRSCPNDRVYADFDFYQAVVLLIPTFQLSKIASRMGMRAALAFLRHTEPTEQDLFIMLDELPTAETQEDASDLMMSFLPFVIQSKNMQLLTRFISHIGEYMFDLLKTKPTVVGLLVDAIGSGGFVSAVSDCFFESSTPSAVRFKQELIPFAKSLGVEDVVRSSLAQRIKSLFEKTAGKTERSWHNDLDHSGMNDVKWNLVRLGVHQFGLNFVDQLDCFNEFYSPRNIKNFIATLMDAAASTESQGMGHATLKVEEEKLLSDALLHDSEQGYLSMRFDNIARSFSSEELEDFAMFLDLFGSSSCDVYKLASEVLTSWMRKEPFWRQDEMLLALTKQFFLSRKLARVLTPSVLRAYVAHAMDSAAMNRLAKFIMDVMYLNKREPSSVSEQCGLIGLVEMLFAQVLMHLQQDQSKSLSKGRLILSLVRVFLGEEQQSRNEPSSFSSSSAPSRPFFIKPEDAIWTTPLIKGMLELHSLVQFGKQELEEECASSTTGSVVKSKVNPLYWAMTEEELGNVTGWKIAEGEDPVLAERKTLIADFFKDSTKREVEWRHKLKRDRDALARLLKETGTDYCVLSESKVGSQFVLHVKKKFSKRDAIQKQCTQLREDLAAISRIQASLPLVDFGFLGDSSASESQPPLQTAATTAQPPNKILRLPDEATLRVPSSQHISSIARMQNPKQLILSRKPLAKSSSSSSAKAISLSRPTKKAESAEFVDDDDVIEDEDD